MESTTMLNTNSESDVNRRCDEDLKKIGTTLNLQVEDLTLQLSPT